MTIRVDDEVWAEVFAAASRYERERVALGEEFVAAVDGALEAIEANPEACALWPDILQDDPPSPGDYCHVNEERVTEWPVELLVGRSARSARSPTSSPDPIDLAAVTGTGELTVTPRHLPPINHTAVKTADVAMQVADGGGLGDRGLARRARRLPGHGRQRTYD